MQHTCTMAQQLKRTDRGFVRCSRGVPKQTTAHSASASSAVPPDVQGPVPRGKSQINTRTHIFRHTQTHARLHTHSHILTQAEEGREQEQYLRLYWDRPFGSDYVHVQCKEVSVCVCVCEREREREREGGKREKGERESERERERGSPPLAATACTSSRQPSHPHTQVSFRVGEIEPLWCSLALYWLDYRVERQHQVCMRAYGWLD